jgi:hypothetical protein
MEGQMATEQDVIIQINDITNRVSTTITTMAGDTRSVADKLAALQGAITSGNQAAVSAAMDNIAPELGKMSAMADQLDTIKTALHTIASDPNNPTEIGVPLSALGSGGDVEAAPANPTPAPGTAAPADGSTPVPAAGSAGDAGSAPAQGGNPDAQGAAAPDTAPEATAGSDAQADTGAPAAPDLTGPTNTAVGGAADVPTQDAAGMPSGQTPDTETGAAIGPTVGAPDTAPGA